MKLKIRFRQIAFSLSMLMFFLYGIITNSDYKEYGLLFLFSGIFICLVLFLHHDSIRWQSWTSFQIVVCSIVCLIFAVLSSIKIEDIGRLFTGINFFCYILMFSIIIPRMKCIEFDINNLMIYLFYLFILYSLFFFPYRMIGYSGFLSNSNSFGLANATFFTYFFSCILGKEELNLKYILPSIIAVFFSIISSSRTAVLSIAILAMVAFILKAMERGMDPWVFLRNTIFVVVSIFLICSTTDVVDIFNDSIIAKMMRHQNDLSNGRELIWNRVLENVSILGHPSEFLLDFGLGKAAHNQFLAVVAREGWVSALAYIVLILLCFLESLAFYREMKANPYRYLPLLSCILFILCGMTEIVGVSLCGFLMYYSISLAIGTRYRLRFQGSRLRE